jgi:glycosyltransferase involved in cell wall biosynthesis
MEAVWNNLRRMMALRRAVRALAPQAVISFVDKMNVVSLGATVGMQPKVIVSERTDPAAYDLGHVWKLLRWLFYGRAYRIIVQSRGASSYFLPRFNGKVQVIPNPVMPPPIHREPGHTAMEIVAMGRFSQEKRFDMLLKAFGRLREKHPRWSLTILGDGPLRPMLERLRSELRLEDRVHMPGHIRDTYSYLDRASLFVLCSEFEGFPNALCEAMACGLPVIATDCPSGPREIIRHGMDGILVPPDNEDELVSAMDRLMADRAERQRLGVRAVDVTQRFSVERVMKMWDDVLMGAKNEERAG